MKKIALSTVTLGLLLTPAFSSTKEAQAADINYLNSKVVKQVKEGTLSLDGFKLGNKVSKYYNSSYYAHSGHRLFVKGDDLYISKDRAMADFQKNTPFSSLRINRIVDKQVMPSHYISRTQIKLKYGNPILTQRKDIFTGAAYVVDIYKNATFYYYETLGEDKYLILHEVVLMKNKYKTSREKWMYYSTKKMNFDANNMKSFISSSQWKKY